MQSRKSDRLVAMREKVVSPRVAVRSASVSWLVEDSRGRYHEQAAGDSCLFSHLRRHSFTVWMPNLIGCQPHSVGRTREGPWGTRLNWN